MEGDEGVVVLGKSRWLSLEYLHVPKSVVVFCGSWWFVVVHGGLWWLMVVCGGSWWFVVVNGSLWWLMVVCGG